jgi:hypothetical protein
MRTAVMMKRIAEMSPRFKARMAGVLFLFLVLTSTFTEFFARGRLSFAAHIAGGVIEVSCMIAVTLLFYYIFKPVHRRLSLLAASFNFVAVTILLLQVLSECTDGDRGLVLADLSVPDAHKLFVPLRYGLRVPRGRIGVPVAPRDGLERS